MSIVPFEPEEQLTRQAVNERVREVKAHLEGRENPHGVAAWQTEVSADTRTVLGLAAGATADDAILQSYLKSISSAYVRVQLLYYDGTPVASEPVVVSPGNKTIYTDREGRMAFLHAGSSASFAVSKYLDMRSNGVSLSTPIGTVVDKVLTFPKSSTQQKFTASVANVLFSPKVASIDVFCVGGGGGGSQAGGGGGYTATKKNLPGRSTPENLTVGAGGSFSGMGKKARDGGVSSFYGVVANGGIGGGGEAIKDGGFFVGGAGGSGGGAAGLNVAYGGYAGAGGRDGSGGGNGYDGSQKFYHYGGSGQGTTTREFGEADGALYAGGGGGGEGANAEQCVGGEGGGGNGAVVNGGNGSAGTSGMGGGGGGCEHSTGRSGGSGGSGCVIVRWRYR